jgi:FMN phosphatase YigB (HAD superfamily)
MTSKNYHLRNLLFGDTMDPVLRPTILIFDLDGTTHDIFETDAEERSSKRATLSESAEDETAELNDEKGISVWFVGNGKEGKVTHKMQAICREKFKEILDRAYALQWQYGAKSPLAIKIITRGDYEEHEILNCWDRFYADDDQRFSRKNFPIEFFNRLNFKKNGKPIPLDAADSEFIKGELMDEMYPIWEKQMPGLTKEKVFLVDDSLENEESAKKHGFSVIKFPTTIYSRKPGDTFTEFGPKAFKDLHHIIDEAAGCVLRPT